LLLHFPKRKKSQIKEENQNGTGQKIQGEKYISIDASAADFDCASQQSGLHLIARQLSNIRSSYHLMTVQMFIWNALGVCNLYLQVATLSNTELK